MEATESLLGGSLVKARRPALLAERAKAAGTPLTPLDPTESQEYFWVEWQPAPTDPYGCDEPRLLGAFSATNGANQRATTEGRPNMRRARPTSQTEPAAVSQANTTRPSGLTRSAVGA